MTSPRQYTPKEIKDLRQLAENMFLYGCYVLPDSCCSSGYDERDLILFVEETTRTNMLAGHTAADLIRSEIGHNPG